MGCFDTVYAQCPKCDHQISFQSKAGNCNLVGYPLYSVPVEIAADLHGASKACENCGTEVDILYPQKIERVAMILRRRDDGYSE